MKAAEAIKAGTIGEVSHWRVRKATGIDTDNKYYQTAWWAMPDPKVACVIPLTGLSSLGN
jgi:hypothetical protein